MSDAPISWLPMVDAPRDGTVIDALCNGEVTAIRWAESRQCMLAGVGGGNGYFGPGWEDDYNHLVVINEPEGWRDQP